MNELALSASEAERFITDTRCGGPPGRTCRGGWLSDEDECPLCIKSPGRRKLREWVTVVDTPPTKRCDAVWPIYTPVAQNHGRLRPEDHPAHCGCKGSGTRPLEPGDVVTITGPCTQPDEMEDNPTAQENGVCGECNGTRRVTLGVGTITNIERWCLTHAMPSADHGCPTEAWQVTLADVERTDP